jgi:hypothetical protein
MEPRFGQGQTTLDELVVVETKGDSRIRMKKWHE